VANPNVGQRIAANWELVVKTKPEDQIHADYWLFNRLSKGDGFVGKSGGDFITCPIEYAENSTVSSYSDLDLISTTRSDVFDRYEAQWKEHAGTIAHSDLEADRNAGEGQVFDLLAGKMDSLKNSIRGDLNEMFFGLGTGNSSKDLNGLQDIVQVSPSSGTFQGISRSTYSFARNQQTTGTLTTSAFDNLRAAMRSNYNLCSNGISSDHPSFAVTTRTVFEGFEGLLLANERFTEKGEGQGAFETLKFKSALISFDADCLSGALYFLNPKFLKLVYKTGSWMKAQPAIRPANQTVDITVIRTMGNLFATNPRRLGVVSSIT
jgi:hypothetical protein